MPRRRLGAGGPLVSAIGLGCLSFGGSFGSTTDEDSLRTLDAAWDFGIDFLDTANIYGNGRSETVIGTWLRSRKHKVHIATKAAFVTGPERRIDNSAAHLRAELEGSLRRLGVEHVDLFYIHRREATRPVEDVADTLGRLVAEGKIGGYGLSEVAPATVRLAHSVHPVTAVQNEYSIWTRLPELGVIQTCADLGIAFVPFSPLARGTFGSVPFDPSKLEKGEFRRLIPRLQAPHWPHNAARIEAFRPFALSRGWSLPAFALAWTLDRGGHVIPIPGTRTAAHLADWKGATDIRFSDEDRREIDSLLPAGWAHGDRYSDEQTVQIERYC
jgi:aryl-alcohol dehydrogenase-like predicted oxidoreductase